MTRVAIIGTAGRKRQPERRHARFMLDAAREFIRGREGVTLVSGGAAWADHTAVLLAAQDELPLVLHLPCAWDAAASSFVGPSGSAGSTMNHWHRAYSEIVFGNERGSRRQVGAALGWERCRKTMGGGFWMRNAAVADSDVILAFTFGESEPVDGGTRQTWDMARILGRELHHVGLT